MNEGPLKAACWRLPLFLALPDRSPPPARRCAYASKLQRDALCTPCVRPDQGLVEGGRGVPDLPHLVRGRQRGRGGRSEGDKREAGVPPGLGRGRAVAVPDLPLAACGYGV